MTQQWAQDRRRQHMVVNMMLELFDDVLTISTNPYFNTLLQQRG